MECRAGWSGRENWNGCDRDRTDDLYRVKVAGVVYVINSFWCSLVDFGSIHMMFGAYCSHIVPKFEAGFTGSRPMLRVL